MLARENACSPEVLSCSESSQKFKLVLSQVQNFDAHLYKLESEVNLHGKLFFLHFFYFNIIGECWKPSNLIPCYIMCYLPVLLYTGH